METHGSVVDFNTDIPPVLPIPKLEAPDQVRGDMLRLH